MLRNLESISDIQNYSIKSSLNKENNTNSLKQQAIDLKKNLSIYQKLINNCEQTLLSLSNDLFEILNNTKLNKKNLKMILDGLINTHLNDQLDKIKKELNNLSQSSLFKGLLSMSDLCVNDNENMVTERKSISQTPETLVKKSFRSLKKIVPSSKTSLKISTEQNKIKNMKQSTFKKKCVNEVENIKELKSVLKQSKQEYKCFLRSLGWTEDRIDEIIKQENFLLSSHTKEIIKNSAEPPSNSAVTKTLNVVIKEYQAEPNEKIENNTISQTDFYSKKTNNVKNENTLARNK